MKINNKGFTFVEILAVIILIGIITGISIAAFSKYKENAIKGDYEALARSSYNAMEEYMMSHPYDDSVSLETLENENLLSNRKDPGSKEDCTGSVEVSKNSGSNGKLDDGTYKVHLCCVSIQKTYTYPGGKSTDLTDSSKCEYVPEEEPEEPIIPPTPGTKYTLKYNDNSGSGCSNKSITKNAGEAWGSLCTPTRSGYTFNGWYDGSTKYTSTTKATKNVTVKANWTSNTAPKYTCAAGKYLPKNKTTCATCIAGNYCKGGTWPKSTVDQGLTKCPTGYKNSPSGSFKVEQCYMNVTGGKYVKNKKDTTTTACGTGTYKAEHSVYYNSTSKCSNCPTGYGNSATGSSKVEQCYMNVTAAKYVKNKKDANATSCGTGTYKAEHTVYYNSTSKCSNCPTGYRNGPGTTKESNCIMNVPVNKYVKKAKDSSSTACPSGQLNAAHKVYYGKISSCGSKSITVTFNCNGGTKSGGPASATYKSDVSGQKFTTTCTRYGHTQGGWKRDKSGTTNNYSTNSGVSENFVLTYSPKLTIYAHWNLKEFKCNAGQYLPKATESCATCLANYYCPGGTYKYNETNNQGINNCSTNAPGYANSAAGSDAVNDCYMKVPENKYIKTEKDKTATSCPSGQYKEAHNVFYGKKSSCVGKSLVVTFNCNGGSGGGTQTLYSNVTGQKFNTKCNPPDSCKVQDGWKRDKNGSTSNYSTNSGVSENFVLTYTPKLTLYAHWKVQSIKCNAGYYLKKGATSCTKCEAGYYCPGNTYTCSTSSDQGRTKCPNCYTNSNAGSTKQSDCYASVSKDHYIKTANSCQVACPGGKYKAAHNVNYGKVSSCANESIVVTFDCNGGTRSGSATSTYTTDATGQSFKTSCSRTGYEMDGWNLPKNKNGAKADYSVSSGVSQNWILTNKPKITLYAHWKPHVCTVTYNPGKNPVPNNKNGTAGKFNNNSGSVKESVPYGSYFGDATNGMRNATGGYYNATLDYNHIDSSKAWVDSKNSSRTFNENSRYLAQNVCTDLGSNKNSTITLKVNWQKNGIKVNYKAPSGLKLAPSLKQACPESVGKYCYKCEKGNSCIKCESKTNESGCTGSRTGLVKKTTNYVLFDSTVWASEGVKDNADAKKGKLYMTSDGTRNGKKGDGKWTAYYGGKKLKTFGENEKFLQAWKLPEKVGVKDKLKKGNIEIDLIAVK